ncbi:hypothetical protein [Curtobacterium flaccumfaciens]|uniref:hypothetical protein n=1 Tax=Curtobacterium flaccumfaciens TaxID=2035 RepID=UPI000FFE6B80|nr:hypothetical protein [Curtobacterium flaccumfaciens]MCS0644585.1 hypothetical protein [Curtobacterium flaccumfaciens pv. flaccumfaciens]MCS6525166.1 hypothetical protein [Curtobacterium flaccumfaciens pv. flaccumfaciens]NUU09525.1 hypothetical protein [Curtobacterium flaccumfaciens]
MAIGPPSRIRRGNPRSGSGPVAISVSAAVHSTPAPVRDGLEADVGKLTRHPTQRHSGRTPEALHRARDEEQRWRTTTISGGTTGTAEIDPGGTATGSRVAAALRVGTARAMVVGRPVLVSSSAAKATVVIVRRVETVRSVTVHPAGTALRVAMGIVRSGPATGTTVRRGRATVVTLAGRRVAMVRAVPIGRDATAIVPTVEARTARLVTVFVRSVVGALTVRAVTVTARSRVVQTVRVVMAIARTAGARTVPLVMATVRTVAGRRIGRAVTGTDPSRAVQTVRVAMATARTAGAPIVPLVTGTARTAGAPIVPLVTETVRTVVVRPTVRPVVVRPTVRPVVVHPTVRSAGVRRIARLATAAKTVVVSVTAAVTPAPVSVRPRATTGRTATPTARSRSVRATTTRRSPRRSRRATSTPPPGWS